VGAGRLPARAAHANATSDKRIFPSDVQDEFLLSIGIGDGKAGNGFVPFLSNTGQNSSVNTGICHEAVVSSLSTSINVEQAID
jgi:hypothetical protein